MSSNTKTEPVFAVDDFWPVTGAVWENVDGQGRLTFSYTIKRSYFDQAAEDYRSTHWMYETNAMAHKAVIDAVWHWLATEGRQRIRDHQKSAISADVDARPADTSDPRPRTGQTAADEAP